MAGTISNYKEFTAGLIGTVAVLGAFLAFAASGWDGDPDPCFHQPNGCYCENINESAPMRSAVRRHPGWFAQPANTWSNIGFILVGLSILWWIGWERATTRAPSWTNSFTNGSWYPAIFGYIVIFMGPGSMFYHASLREWGGFLDTLSMNLFMAFILSYNISRYYRLAIGWFVLIFCVLIAAVSSATLADSEHSTVYFYILCALAFVSQVRIYWNRNIVSAPWGWWWFIAGASVFLTAFTLWRLSWTKGPLCDPTSAGQGHGAWHLLSAGMTFCLWQYFRAEDASAVIPDWMWKMANVFFGIVIGLVIAGGFGYVLADQILGTDKGTTLILAACFGVVGGIYSALAFRNKIYGHGFFAILGYLLDMTWSWINTLAGLLVWIPVCKIVGGNLRDSTDDSRRSGCFVYDKNPRGSGWDTTIGTVVAGSWSAHEEIHVWQARIFGPVYLITWGLSWLLNMLFRMILWRFRDLTTKAYRRIMWEDWAYWAGSSSSNVISWGPWIGGFFLALLYLSVLALIPIGIAIQSAAMWIAGIAGLTLYSVIRSLTGAQ